MAVPATTPVQPDKSHSATARTVTHSEARSSASWWTVTIAAQVG